MLSVVFCGAEGRGRDLEHRFKPHNHHHHHHSNIQSPLLPAPRLTINPTPTPSSLFLYNPAIETVRIYENSPAAQSHLLDLLNPRSEEVESRWSLVEKGYYRDGEGKGGR